MTSRRFERMVIGLPQEAGNQSAIRAAADLAEVLHIELRGAFIADANLRSLMGLPGRELRMPDLQWQPIDLERISRDLEHIVRFARSRFAESVGNRDVKTSFEVVGGARIMGSLIRAGDIVSVIEPAHPGESITLQFTGLLDAAQEAAAAILLIPRRILRPSGPVMAVATSGDDPSIQAALEIAAALKERLLVTIQTGAVPQAEILADAARLGVEVQQIIGGSALVDMAAATLFASRPKERLRVMSQRSGDVHRLLSSLHGIPHLVVEDRRAHLTAALEKAGSP